ncbi:MAG: hypothetical protein V4474_04420 [Patescibacteria group bacterium]
MNSSNSTTEVASSELTSWTVARANKVAGPIDWAEAVKQYRLHTFDIIWRDVENRWYGYKLKPEFFHRVEEGRALVDQVYALTLQRSIA